jgi:HlyD family secretion protein
MKKRTLIAAIAIAVVVLGTGGYFVSKGKESKAQEIETAVAKRAKIIQKVNGTGKIQPNTEINISADVSAKITRLDVKEGDHVEKGQLLVELDRQKYLASVQSQEAQVRSAQANARLALDNRNQAERVYKRARELVGRKLVSQSELDTAQTAFQVDSSRYQAAMDQVQQAIGSLRQSQDDLSKTTIYAPISGTISDLKKERGEIAIGSQFQEDVIMKVAQLGAMEALVNVDENDINSIKVGQPAEIEVDAALGEKVTGVVSEIASSATVPAAGSTAQKTEFEVKIAITSDTSKLRPGMTASADIVTETRDNALSVPIQSVTVRTLDQLKPKDGKDGKDSKDSKNGADAKDGKAAATGGFTAGKDGFVEVVWVVVDGKAAARQVTTGIQSDDAIEIKTGLKEGDTVVSGSYRAISRDLNIGDAVTIKKPGDKSSDKSDDKTAAGGN